LAISPNGQTVYVVGTPDRGLGHTEDTLTAISTATDQVVKTTNLGSYANATQFTVAVSPSGKTVYALGSGSTKAQGVLIPVNTATDVVGETIPVGYNASAMVFSPNGSWAYVLDYGVAPNSPGGVVPINLGTGTAGKRIAVSAYAEAMVVS
jgi:hypothetical protein